MGRGKGGRQGSGRTGRPAARHGDPRAGVLRVQGAQGASWGRAEFTPARDKRPAKQETVPMRGLILMNVHVCTRSEALSPPRGAAAAAAGTLCGQRGGGAVGTPHLTVRGTSQPPSAAEPGAGRGRAGPQGEPTSRLCTAPVALLWAVHMLWGPRSRPVGPSTRRPGPRAWSVSPQTHTPGPALETREEVISTSWPQGHCTFVSTYLGIQLLSLSIYPQLPVCF